MSWSWKIQKAAVEQEILFPSEKVYENYIAGCIRKKEPFEIVDEKANEDGTYTVVMRKKYNNNPFFRKEDELPDEVLKKLLQEELEQEAESFMEKVDADPELRNVQAPLGMYDKIMAKIRENEMKGNA